MVHEPLSSQLAGGGSWRLRGGLLPFVALAAYRGQFIEPCGGSLECPLE